MEKIGSIDIYVRFCETDMAGHISNTSYFLYMEEARTRFFTAMGYSPETRKEVSFIIAKTECNYISQAYAGQTLTVKTTIAHIGTKSFKVNQEISETTTKTVIAKGSTVIVCFDVVNQQSITIPEQLRTNLEGNLVTS